MRRTRFVPAVVLATLALAGCAAVLNIDELPGTDAITLDASHTDAALTDSSSSGSSGRDAQTGKETGPIQGDDDDVSPPDAGDGGDASEGGTTAPPSFTKYYTALCAMQKRCTPAQFGASFTSDADCLTLFSGFQASAPLPGTAKPDQAALDACASKINSATCIQQFSNFTECMFKGTLSNGAPCNDASQCSSGVCKKVNPTDNCGSCDTSTAPPPPLHKGDTCTLNQVCEVGTQCSGPATTGQYKCIVPKDLNEACSPQNILECRNGLTCTNGKCAELPYAHVNQTCGSQGGGTYVQCGFYKYSCVGQPGAQTCVPNAKADETCSSGGDTLHPNCSLGQALTCDPATLACSKQPAPNVCH